MYGKVEKYKPEDYSAFLFQFINCKRLITSLRAAAFSTWTNYDRHLKMIPCCQQTIFFSFSLGVIFEKIYAKVFFFFFPFAELRRKRLGYFQPNRRCC